MIILEGPNGAGKSTLAKKLSVDLGFRIHKFTEIPKTKAEWQTNHEKSLELLKEPVIQDRCPAISEWVYAPIVEKRKPFCGLKDVFEIIENLDGDHTNYNMIACARASAKSDHERNTNRVIVSYKTLFQCVYRMGQFFDGRIPNYYNFETTPYKSVLFEIRRANNL